ncbi:PREDICTED: cytochrome b5-like isoform X1 [Branchiostoma belcheri]|uniref:Cytochrome b5 n=1 Tax=Branchiostoma belcheri TaxID=7741 RepID=A0A6P4ZJL0_BRABE|nr:PREDICTED: cytochrome b5-like isoform X1 [Branchiostoma belcheri]
MGEQKKEQPDLKQFSQEEVDKHTTGTSAWIVIHDKVYDVTKFLEEHPGGEEVLLEQSGKDGTEAFEDVGHSEDARELMENYLIGELRDEDKAANKYPEKRDMWKSSGNGSTPWSSYLLPAVIAIVVAIAYRVWAASSS